MNSYKWVQDGEKINQRYSTTWIAFWRYAMEPLKWKRLVPGDILHWLKHLYLTCLGGRILGNEGVCYVIFESLCSQYFIEQLEFWQSPWAVYVWGGESQGTHISTRKPMGFPQASDWSDGPLAWSSGALFLMKANRRDHRTAQNRHLKQYPWASPSIITM